MNRGYQESATGKSEIGQGYTPQEMQQEGQP
jgi:hypothetical protein